MSTKLRRSADRKVTNSVTKSGNVSSAGHNSFGLPAGANYSCPGETAVCGKICYAGKIEKIFKVSHALVSHNFDLLKNSSRDEMVRLLDEMITEFEVKCDKSGADKYFRIHWDGDFFNKDYVEAWRTVILRHPAIQFWAYTRSAFAVPSLVGIENLSVYFSADMANIPVAKALHNTYGEGRVPENGLKIALLTETFDEGINVMRDITGNASAGVACPELSGKLPMISDKGSACGICQQCPMGRSHIRFASKPTV